MVTGKWRLVKSSLWLVGLLLLSFALFGTQQPASKQLPYIDTALLKSGDLIFRRGAGIASNIALNASSNDKRFSHVGVLIKDKTQYYVIHSIDDKMKQFNGVVKEPLENFIEDGDSFGAYRILADEITIKKLTQEAIAFTNRNIGYDNDYDHTNPTKLYCSEFIYVLVNSILGQDIINTTRYLTKEVISIENIYENELFFEKIF